MLTFNFVVGCLIGLLLVWATQWALSRESRRNFKLWAVRATEAWREEHASLDLEWRVFAQKHNAAGHRPMCAYKGMADDPDRKLEMYEFPYGPDSKARPIPPDSLRRAAWDAAKETNKRSQVTGE
jgi:hypothetical protein